MEVTARWEGGYRCTMRIRQFELGVDEPPTSGGTDTGMQPTELLLASLASCFTLAVSHVARKAATTLDDLSVTATGEYEGPRFRRILVRVDSSHPVQDLIDLARRAIHVCYVSNTLRGGPEIEYLVGDVSIHRQPSSPVEAAPIQTP
jgi:putative redox protein